jgi:glycosyltransferase involved in cell wall biosynthesis
MHIALITEGTYPYATGGVSVWCDQLVRTLSADTFDVYALTGSGLEPTAWQFPGNVRRFVPVPLWSPRSAADPGRKIRRQLYPLLERFLLSLSDTGTADEFEGSLRALAEHPHRDQLSRVMATSEAVSLALDLFTRIDPPRPATTIPVPTPTVADAVEVLNQLEHVLRAFDVTPPQADLNHCVTGGLGALVALAGRWRNGTPFLLGEHGLYLRERFLSLKPGVHSHHVRSLLLRFVLRLTELSYSAADLIVPVCHYNSTWERAVGGAMDKVRTVHNGIEAVRFEEPPPEPESPTIVWVGRVDPIKDVETLIRAFAIVSESVPDARLRIFGPAVDPEYTKLCEDLVREQGLGESVAFEGRLAPDAVAGAYHSGQVIALTSISEGFPYAVLEAMAAGRPVVATDVGGVGEALEGAGLLVRPRSPVAVANACLELLGDADLRASMAARARDRVLTNFTLGVSTDQYRDLYLDLTAEHQAARLTLTSSRLVAHVPRPTSSERAAAMTRRALQSVAELHEEAS